MIDLDTSGGRPARTAVSNVAFERYRSLRDVWLELRPLNVLIGPNASGKSSVLDGLKLLHEAVVEREFSEAVRARGGIVHLAWKGEDSSFVRLQIEVTTPNGCFRWLVRLQRQQWDFTVQEEVHEIRSSGPPAQLLHAEGGNGWWWSSDTEKNRVTLRQDKTACALSAASADASFPARELADFVRSWGFYDPSPILLRRATFQREAAELDSSGRNLAARLMNLKDSDRGLYDRIMAATQSVVGLPDELEFRETEAGVYFVQKEPGLKHKVHQVGASSGTLRLLALMTGLIGQARDTLVALEEPENYIHPAALSAFARHLLDARDRARTQVLLTTHSPLLLDFLDDPEAVCVVRRDPDLGTVVSREENPDAIRRALEESGFGLGELYETKGFGA